MQTSKNLIIISLLVLMFLITSCSEDTPTENVPSKIQVTLDINLGFTANMNPEYNASMTKPSPGLYNHVENDTITIKAQNTDKYEFSHWIIKPNDEEEYEVNKQNYTMNLTKNYLATVYFGCAKTEACNKISVCQENKCKPITELEMKPKLTITIPGSTTQREETLAIRIKERLKENKYVHEEEIKSFEDIDIRNLHDQITIAIFDAEIVIITGINAKEPARVLANIIDEIITRQKIPDERIQHIKSNELKTDLYDLFL